MDTVWEAARLEQMARDRVEAAKQGIHTLLDLAGLVPGAGEVADLTNAFLYAIDGDPTNAGLSLAAMLPIGGQAATGARLFRTHLLSHLGVDASQAVGKHAHHILPQQFEREFKVMGLDVHDPKFGVLMDITDHRNLHNVAKYNAEWTTGLQLIPMRLQTRPWDSLKS